MPVPAPTVVPGTGAPAPAAAPYYPSYPTAPSAPAGSAVPSTLGVPTTPGVSQPSVPTPADRRPSLSPTEIPGSSETSPALRNYPPADAAPASPPATGSGLKKVVPSVSPDLNPVPDPDAGGSRRLVPTTPSLIDPREKTARREAAPAWRYLPIVQPENAPAVELRPAAVPTPPASPAQKTDLGKTETQRLDTSGWRAVRP